MQTLDVNKLFARAEQAFVTGQLQAARHDLLQVQRLAGDHPAVLHLLALVEKKRGAADAARQAFARAATLAPNDPQIATNHGNFLSEHGEADAALRAYDRALRAAPQSTDARYNRALLLQRLGRLEEALADLDQVLASRPLEAKAHSARGTILRALDRPDEAAAAYDEALRLDPRRLPALHGRARLAMERGEASASMFYKRALDLQPDDPQLVLGLAQALEAEGEPGALALLERAVDRQPNWLEGQQALARMRWEAGEGEAFTRDFSRALDASPENYSLWFAYASSLAAAGLSAEAAEAAARARALVGDDPALLLLEALHASEAGELGRADRLYAELPQDLRGRSIHEVRHRIRTGDHGRALLLAGRALQEEPWDIGAWALTGLLWRLTGDPRTAWLLEQPGLYGPRSLDLSPVEIAAISDRLRSLHKTRAHPIGQSLRGGTQTRGRLFERSEPEIVLLRSAIEQAVQAHWDGLPSADPAHPLLRHRDKAPRFDGSWSVRLQGGGFHVSHIHPNGILSSACYLVVPAGEQKQAGWLDIGGPPEGLDVPLAPLTSVEPVPGRLALFPSYLFHGTRPFAAGERLTAAFDIVAQ